MKSIMEEITAKKDGQQKKFSQVAWDLLPEHKNGWVLELESEVQVVDNEAEAKAKAEAEKLAKEKADAEALSNQNKIVNNEVIDKFNATADALTANDIKDYLDIKEIKYKASASKKELIDVLKSALENNIETLKSEFKI